MTELIIKTIHDYDREYHKIVREAMEQAWSEGARATYEWILARQNGEQWDEPNNPYGVKA